MVATVHSYKACRNSFLPWKRVKRNSSSVKSRYKVFSFLAIKGRGKYARGTGVRFNIYKKTDRSNIRERERMVSG